MAQPLARELEVALRLVGEGGAWLRRELHAGRADTRLDAQVDEHLHRALRANFPEDFDGTGRRRWWIAAHEGAQAARRGRRGAVVSLALTEADRARLAVVFAYAAPDDDGDLFWWTAETGAPRRNGAEIRRLAAGSSSSPAVLVPEIEDAGVEGLAAAIHPCRFRVVPSAAYRLALAAAGEAEGAVAVHAALPEVAAGLALLRANGGELWDSAGQPVSFPRETRLTCFAGAGLRPPLSSWPGGELIGGTAPARPAALVRDPGLLRRAQGCWFGQLAGDSLRSLVEFETPRSIAARYPQGVRMLADGGTWNTLAGQPTDDSEMALALARTLAREGRYDAAAAGRAYVDWYQSGPFDIGATTRAALSSAARGRRAPASESQANGSLMRISPLGIFGASHDGGDLADLARADAALTHPHPVCTGATSVFAQAVAHALATGVAATAVYAHAREQARKPGVPPAVAEAIDLARLRRPEYLAQAGWVLVALQNACYQLLHAPNLEEGLVDTVMQGGDTDTNAAIAGALLGAVYGREAVPPAWRDRVLTCRPIAALPGAAHPRPPEYWPVDALELAEQLLSPK